MNPMKRKSPTGNMNGSDNSLHVNTSVSTSAEPSQPSKAKKPRLAFSIDADDNQDSRPIYSNSVDPRPGTSHQIIAPNNPIITQRAAKAAKQSGEVGSNNGAKGRVRINAVGIEYFNERTQTWIPAVYHNDLRAHLIREAANQGRYDHERKKGNGPHDVTSFLPSQKSWGGDRKYWPDVLFRIECVRDESLPKHIPLWYRNGQVVLDHDNHPLRVFSSLPSTCSSELEKWHLVAIFHSDHRIQIADIRARMPRYRVAKGKSLPLFTPNAISMRMSRFRKKVGTDPREERAGSKEKKDATKSLIPPECLADNSLKTFSRPLTAEEQKMIEEKNKGKFPQKARAEKRALTTEVSKSTGSSKKRKGGDNGQREGASAKRSRIPTQTGQVETSHGPVPQVQSPVLGTPVDGFVSWTTTWGSTEQHGTNVHGYNHVHDSFAPTGQHRFRRDDGADVTHFNAVQPSGYWYGHQHNPRQDFSGYHPEFVVGEQNGRCAATSTERPYNGVQDRFTYTSAPDFELPQDGSAESTQTRGGSFQTTPKDLVTPGFARFRNEFAESTAVQGGHSQAMSEYSLTPGFELSENEYAESTEAQGASSRVAFDHALESNTGQPRTERVELAETYNQSFHVASSDISTEGMDSNNLAAVQDPSEIQLHLDIFSEPEPETTYPMPETINYGPYGSLPKGYSLLSSSHAPQEPWWNETARAGCVMYKQGAFGDW